VLDPYNFAKKLLEVSIIFQLIAFSAETAMVLTSIYIPYYAYQLGATEIEVGLIGASAGIPYIFIPFLAGRLSDRVGRKKGLLTGVTVVTLSYIMYLLIYYPSIFILVRIVEGVGWSFVWPSMEAIIGDSKRKLQVYNIMWGFGSTIAPYMGSSIYQFYGAKNVLLLSIGLMVASFIFAITGKEEIVLKNSSDERYRGDFRFKPIFFIPFIYGVLGYTLLTFFPIYAEKRALSLNVSGLVLSVMNFGRLSAFVLSNKTIFGKERVQEYFTILLGLVPIGLIFFANEIFLISLFFLLGFSLGVTYAYALGKILSISEANRGYYAGVFESLLGLGAFSGPLIGGMLANLSFNYIFVIPGILILLFIFLKKI
jgi:DHA1 family multidrug resistance protein-like MFS transporter